MKNSKQTKEKSLKDQNTVSLIAVLIVNLAIFAVVLKTDQLLAADYPDILKQWQALIPASLGAILIGVVNGLLSAQAKARLVFWRWKNPLPGSEAFSRYVTLDPRIDVAALKSKLGVFPTDPMSRMHSGTSSTSQLPQIHRSYTCIACFS